MQHAQQIALIDGKPIFRDCEGNLCVESDGQYLRALTTQEQNKLVEVLKTMWDGSN